MSCSHLEPLLLVLGEFDRFRGRRSFECDLSLLDLRLCDLERDLFLLLGDSDRFLLRFGDLDFLLLLSSSELDELLLCLRRRSLDRLLLLDLILIT